MNHENYPLLDTSKKLFVGGDYVFYLEGTPTVPEVKAHVTHALKKLDVNFNHVRVTTLAGESGGNPEAYIIFDSIGDAYKFLTGYLVDKETFDDEILERLLSLTIFYAPDNADEDSYWDAVIGEGLDNF